jgi:hypothetical protein
MSQFSADAFMPPFQKKSNMFEIREATPDDIEFLTIADLKTGAEEDGESTPPEMQDEQAFRNQLAKIGNFVTDTTKGAWVGMTRADGQRAGMILCRFRNRLTEPFDDSTIFDELDTAISPKMAAFAKFFNCGSSRCIGAMVWHCNSRDIWRRKYCTAAVP